MNDVLDFQSHCSSSPSQLHLDPVCHNVYNRFQVLLFSLVENFQDSGSIFVISDTDNFFLERERRNQGMDGAARGFDIDILWREHLSFAMGLAFASFERSVYFF